MKARWWSCGGGTSYCYEKETSINQVARRRRQRKISVGRRLGSPRWPNDRTHTESSQMQCACEVEIALKSTYPHFGSRHWVARDIGTYINQDNAPCKNKESLSAEGMATKLSKEGIKISLAMMDFDSDPDQPASEADNDNSDSENE